MRIVCDYGFYKFFPQKIGEVEVWNATHKKVVDKSDFFTFEFLADFPDHVWEGRTVSGVQITKNFAGNWGDVFKSQKIVYNLNKNLIEPIETITDIVQIDDDGLIVTSAVLYQAGAHTDKGQIIGFSSFWDMNFDYFRVEQVKYASVFGSN